MTKILGISAYYHDSSATLIDNGEIILAAQEERFTRIKHDSSFPKNAIEFILNEKNINLNEINYIVFYDKPFLKLERILETYIASVPKGFLSFYKFMPLWIKEKIFQKNVLINEFNKHYKVNIEPKKIYFSEHHYSHAASAFYPSPFDEAIILTLDGVGEWATTAIGIGKKNSVKIIKEIHFPHSIGLLYSSFTYYLGFKVNSGEYKVMGLAPYGEAKYKNLILEKILDLKEDGSFRMDMNYFNYVSGLTMVNKKFCRLFDNPIRNENEKITQFHMDIAASIQKVIEEIILKIASYANKNYNINNLCLAGGVALNCVANSKILKKNLFEKIWIQPAAGDAGGSLGAALNLWHNELKNNRIINKSDSMKGCYLGPKYENESIKKILIKEGAIFKYLNEDEIINETVKFINKGMVVGWFQGRMEFGPRALGNRSIIADPRSENMQKILNLKVKNRESFRPFAPSIIREDLNNWFDLNIDSPYMLLVANIKDEHKIKTSKKENELYGFEKINSKRSSVTAVTHVDYSSRIQTVHEKTNALYYKLISNFKRYSGCPMIINTSFNNKDEPIVCSPEDAYKCFINTEIDILVCGNFLIKKSDQKKNLNF